MITPVNPQPLSSLAKFIELVAGSVTSTLTVPLGVETYPSGSFLQIFRTKQGGILLWGTSFPTDCNLPGKRTSGSWRVQSITPQVSQLVILSKKANYPLEWSWAGISSVVSLCSISPPTWPIEQVFCSAFPSSLALLYVPLPMIVRPTAYLQTSHPEGHYPSKKLICPMVVLAAAMCSTSSARQAILIIISLPASQNINDQINTSQISIIIQLDLICFIMSLASTAIKQLLLLHIYKSLFVSVLGQSFLCEHLFTQHNTQMHSYVGQNLIYVITIIMPGSSHRWDLSRFPEPFSKVLSVQIINQQSCQILKL